MTDDPTAPVVGVGPHPGPWPDDARLDPELLAEGDRRNVGDEYRYWRLEAIVADLDTRRQPLHVAIQNWEHDFNIGSIVRTANAFNVAAVHIVGRRRWNRRGAMVTDRYLHVHHHETEHDLIEWLAARGVTAIGVDNLPGSVPLETAALRASAVWCSVPRGPDSPTRWSPTAPRWWPSPSTARRARSTPAPRRRSPCTTGRSSTRRADPARVDATIARARHRSVAEPPGGATPTMGPCRHPRRSSSATAR